ncbi:MAG: hypothetical protein SNJ29_12835 [Rikenellaceae bacterium]
MKTKVVKILEGINVPHNNGNITIDAHDIEEAFNLDDELVIKEFEVDGSLKKVGGEIAKIAAEGGLTKVALFIVAADLNLSELEQFSNRIVEQDLYVIFGVYEPNEGEPNRVVAIMQ